MKNWMLSSRILILKRNPKRSTIPTSTICPSELATRMPYPFTQMYVKKDFLNKEECNKLIDFIDDSLGPSTVADKTDSGLVSSYRTSSTANLHFLDDEFYLKIDQKITSFMGIDPFLGESLQAQKYKPGQYYKEHCDFFIPTQRV